MSVQSIVDAATNPNAALPIATAGTLMNLLMVLPHIISIGWFIYLVLLISHKVWSMYKEWRDDPKAPWHRRSIIQGERKDDPPHE